MDSDSMWNSRNFSHSPKEKLIHWTFLGASHEMGGGNEGTLVIIGFTGATEIMLFKCDGVSCWWACKNMGEQGQNSKLSSGAGGPNEIIPNMERYKIRMNNPLHKYKVGGSLQNSKKVLVVLRDHKINVSNALLFLGDHSYPGTNRHENSLWNSLLSLLSTGGFLDWVLCLIVDCRFHKGHRLV